MYIYIYISRERERCIGNATSTYISWQYLGKYHECNPIITAIPQQTIYSKRKNNETTSTGKHGI